MRRFFVMLKKELRELATKQILLPFLLTILMFVFIGQLVGQQGEQAEATRRLRMLDLDGTPASASVLQAAEEAGFAVDLATSGTPDAQVAAMRADGTSVLLVVPDGFAEAIAAGRQAPLGTYVVIRDFSFMGSSDSGALGQAVSLAAERIRLAAAEAVAPGIDPAFLKEPFVVTPNVVIGEKQAAASPDAIMGFVGSQTTFVPIILFLVIVFAMQMVATAVATEKENKTLESLLAMPVSRSGLVAAKMLAAGAIALLSAAAYIIGMGYYMRGMERGFGGGAGGSLDASRQLAEQLGMTLGVGDYALMGLSIFAAVLVALAVALMLGAFAENVKAVQSLLTPVMILVMVPYFLTLLTDVSSLPMWLQWFVRAIPFSHPFVAAPNLFLGNIGTVVGGIVYQLAWFVVLVFVAARIFSSDKILTMRLSLGKKRGAAA
jgi:ABC-2 type transport system permease protein